MTITAAQRRRAPQTRNGYRPTNEWGGGILPAPYAEGDLLQLARPSNERLHGMGPGMYVVTYATSVDYGDAWYFRVWDGKSERGSDRLHVAFADRSTFDEGVDWMEPFDLLDTADPEGLELRARLLEGEWSWSVGGCRSCGGTGIGATTLTFPDPVCVAIPREKKQ